MMSTAFVGRMRAAVLFGLFPLLGGCEVALDLLLPTTVTVELVNEGSLPVEVDLFLSDQQDIPEFLLTQVGEHLTFTVEAGETVSFTRTCDDLKALVIDDADLRVIGGFGPDTRGRVRREDTDFACGDTLRFTFTHPEDLLSLQLDFTRVVP